MTVQDILQEIKNLSLAEHQELMEALEDIVPHAPSHSLLDIIGLGAETWKDVDAQQYINDLRDEWDHR